MPRAIGAAAVLDEVDRGEQADRDGDDRGGERDLERADDRVDRAAARAVTLRIDSLK